MFDKLEDLLIRYEELMSELSEPDVANNPERFRKLMKEQSDLAPIVEAYQEYKNCKQNVEESLMILEEEKEPTEHILNEMMEQEEAFAGYAEQIIFVVRSKEALETPTLSKALAKLKNIQIYYDDFSEIINTLGRRMYVDPDKLPLIIVTNGTLNGIYATSGYNVGTGDMLLRLM